MEATREPVQQQQQTIPTEANTLGNRVPNSFAELEAMRQNTNPYPNSFSKTSTNFAQHGNTILQSSSQCKQCKQKRDPLCCYAKSMNLPAARANLKVDIDYAYNFAKNAGLKSLVAKDKAPAALSLGGLTNGVTVMEMANAYATIANGGVYIKPRLYTKITDSKDQEVIVNNIKSKRVMKESTAFMLTSCLQEVVKTGTAAGYVPGECRADT